MVGMNNVLGSICDELDSHIKLLQYTLTLITSVWNTHHSSCLSPFPSFHFQLLPANCLPPFCQSALYLTAETELVHSLSLALLITHVCEYFCIYVILCLRPTISTSLFVCGCVCVYLRMNNRMLPLILAMWHFANLISLARSGQHARLDCECVRVPACVHEWVCL